MPYTTEQEEFWAGEFGDAYIERNEGPDVLASKTAMFARALSRAGVIGSVIEFGANIGLNLQALKTLLPKAALHGVEINPRAFAQLSAIDGATAELGSWLDFSRKDVADLAISSGVLIHIDPAAIERAYAILHGAARRYVFLAEYYNPTPVEVTYRGHSARLFKRDWAGEMLRQFDDLHLVDYGFIYHLDPQFPTDDVNWFLLEKRAR
jgi:pseudaminic acid biosynthesis-associated methylase